jgi:predicted phosphodiesterase
LANYTIEQSGIVTSVYFSVKARWEQWVLLMSDVHHDSVYCNREMETEFMEAARERRALIAYFGDYFDAMQGRFDPRRSMAELRPEYRREDYYDFVVQDTADYLSRYAKQILLMAKGNHETAVLKHANTDLLDRLVFMLNTKHKTQIRSAGYGGWIRFMFDVEGVPRCSVKLKYFHGAGAEAPVTKGVIQANRQAVYLPDADIVVNGHNHNEYCVTLARERLSNKGVQYFDLQRHIRIPGFKMDYADGSGGWLVEKGGTPKPIGAAWLKFSYRTHPQSIDVQVIPDPRVPVPVAVAKEGE